MPERIPTPRDRAGAHAPVAALLLSAAVLVLVTALTVTGALHRQTRADLDYAPLLSAVDAVLDEMAPVQAAPVRELLPSGQVLEYDTLFASADAGVGGLEPGGFLRDQIATFNAFERDRATLARRAPAWFDELAAQNPSLLRVLHDGRDSARVAHTAAAWSLRVSAPGKEQWNGQVLSGSRRRRRGLVNGQVAIAFDTATRLPVHWGRRESMCEFHPQSADLIGYCVSEERIPQLRLRNVSSRAEEFSLLAGYTGAWVDGRRVAGGSSATVADGSVLDVDPVGAVIAGEFDQGVISAAQWTNGRVRRRAAEAPPLDVFAALARSARVDHPSRRADLPITVDPRLTRQLSQALQKFVKEDVPEGVRAATIVVATVPDGHILALAEAGRRVDAGRTQLMEPVAPGSAVKPVLAAAVLSRKPQAAGLRLAPLNGSFTAVPGLPPVAPSLALETDLNCGAPAGGAVDLHYFIRCSNNQFAAALVMEGLRPDSGRLPLVGHEVPREALLRSPLSEGLTALYDVVTDPEIARRLARNDRLWQGLRYTDGTPATVPPELQATESRPVLIAPEHPRGTDLSLLYRYAIGSWEDRWTLPDLVGAFARVATDRRVQITFAPDAPAPPPLGLARFAWYPVLLDALAAVGRDGTAKPLRDAPLGLTNALTGALGPVRVLSKTGTLNERGGRGSADDLAVKSLLIAAGRPGPAGTVACGVAVGIYLRLDRAPDRSVPSYHLRFAEERLAPLLHEQRTRVLACGR